MAIAEASGTEVVIANQPVAGTAATTNGTTMRYTGESLNFSPNTIQSNEITTDADIADLIAAGGAAEGDINFELSSGDPFVLLMEHALRADFGAETSPVLTAADARKQLTIEKIFDVGTPNIRVLTFRDMRVNTLSMTIQPNGIVTGVVGFRGAQESSGTVRTITSPASPNANPVIETSRTGTIVLSGGLTAAFDYTDLSFALNNNLRDLPEIGSTDPVDVNYGQRVITGTLAAYFDENGLDLYTALLNGSAFGLTIPLRDNQGTPQGYDLVFPRLKLSAGEIVAEGNNQDVLANMQWTATRGALTVPTANSAMRIIHRDGSP